MIETVKDILNFCNYAIYLDYNKIGVVIQLDNVRKCIYDNFNKTAPQSKISECLRIIDDMISKINENDVENIITKIYELRENIIYMIGCKTLAENKI